MSDLFTPSTAAVYDPIIRVDEKATYPIIKGGLEVTERYYTTTDFSSTNCSFTVPPPNPTTFVSRRFKLYAPIKILLTGKLIGYEPPNNLPDNGFPIIPHQHFALRQYPLASIMNTLGVTLNGTGLTLVVNEVIKPLLLYHNNDRNLEARELSTSPGMRDKASEYYS